MLHPDHPLVKDPFQHSYTLEPFPLPTEYQPPEPEVWPQPNQPEPQLTSRERREIRDMLNWWKGRVG